MNGNVETFAPALLCTNSVDLTLVLLYDYNIVHRRPSFSFCVFGVFTNLGMRLTKRKNGGERKEESLILYFPFPQAPSKA